MAATTTTTPTVTDITLVREDSDEILFTVREPDPLSVTAPPALQTVRLDQAVDGTPNRNAIVRFAAKEDPDDPPAAALIYKDSSDPEDVVFLDQTAPTTEGQGVIYIDKGDTTDFDAGTHTDPVRYPHDLEVTRQDFIRSGAQGGTLSLVAGAKTVVGAGTTFAQARVGDVLQPLGGINDAKPAVIQSVTDDNNVTVHHANWVNEANIAFEIRRGRSFTGARGDICLVHGQVLN